MWFGWLVAIMIGWSGLETQTQPITIAARSRSVQPGELVVLTATTVTPATALRVTAFGTALLPYRIDPLTWRVLVGIDLGVTPGKQPVLIEATSSAGVIKATYDLAVVAKAFRTRTLQLSSSPATASDS